MKKHQNGKKLHGLIIGIIGALSLFSEALIAQVVYTPNGTPIHVTIQEETRSLDDILSWNTTYRKQYPNAQFLGDSSNTMNCHGYAWHVAEGGVPVTFSSPDPYWNDGSYIGSTTIGPGNSSQADKALYASTHSAITIPQNAWLISKWGYQPLMRHPYNHSSYNNETSLITYYRAARQPRANPFAVTYGGSGAEAATSMSFTVDGGVIVAGTTTSFGASGTDGWLLKLAANGTIPFPNNTTHTAGGWQKRYGGAGNDTLTAVVQAYDYGYVAAGYTTSFSGNEDGWLFHLDQNGGRGTCNYKSGGCWSQVYNSSHNMNDRLLALARWSNYTGGTYLDGYIAAGRTNLGGLNGYDLWVQKVDRTGSLGSLGWQHAYGGAGQELASAIQPIDADGDSTTNDGYLVAGAILDGSYDLLLLKLDEQGHVGTSYPGTWQKRYGGAGYDTATAIQQTDDDGDGFRDDGSIIAGYTNSFGAGSYDAWILKLDKDGNEGSAYSGTWQHTYGGTGDDYANAILQTGDGGYLVAGYTTSFGAAAENAWVLKLGPAGNVLWANRYSGTGSGRAVTAQQAVDGGYLVAGQTPSSGGDLLLLRIAADGSSVSCPPGVSITAQVQKTTPSFSSPAVTLPAGDATMASSTPPLSSAETTSQPASICPEHSYLLWTK